MHSNLMYGARRNDTIKLTEQVRLIYFINISKHKDDQ